METDTMSVLRAELGPMERLLWSGLPRRGIKFHALDLFLIPFGLVWCAFIASFDLALASGDDQGGFLPVFGIAAFFSFIGLYMLIGRFVVDAVRRAHTVYGITDQRIVILTTLVNRRVKSLDLRTLSDVSMAEKPNGRGTITFGPQTSAGQLAGVGWPTAGPVSPSFEDVENAKAVYGLIRQAQRAD